MYNIITSEIERLKQKIEYFSIGKSELGQEIICFKLGTNENKKIIIQCSIHAREYITTLFALKQIEFLAGVYIDATIYYLPLTNPDGVQLVLEGLKNIKSKTKRQLLTKINGGGDFSLWKANINCVDLNTNFDAKWGSGKLNVKHLASENFIGEYPNSEKEVRMLTRFTKKIMPDITLSYHCKGEIVYFGFENKLTEKEKTYLKAICKATGYKPEFTTGSSGGYKDWCLEKFKIPSYTIEVGDDIYPHPFPISELNTIYEQNRYLPLILAKLI